jgi:plastocyanin
LVCGTPPDVAGPAPQFRIVAHNLNYDRSCISTGPGRLMLVLVNQDPGVKYSLTVDSPSGQKIITSGVLTGPRTFSLSFVVSPGRYTYHCDVHARMTGVLEVT